METPIQLINLVTKKTENTQWPIDCVLKRIDEFDEILILAKKKNPEHESYVRFSSGLGSTFWWIGVLEAMKRNLMEESLIQKDD